jgi:hypothetical protein
VVSVALEVEVLVEAEPVVTGNSMWFS